MTPEVKMRLLAQQDPDMQSYFFTDGQVRWFDKQLQPNYLKPGKTCARIRRIGTVRLYSHETATRAAQNSLTQPRFQIDVLDFDSERARSAAAAIVDWLGTVSFADDSQFASPPTSPKGHPNVVLDQREGMEPMPQPAAHVVSLDVRIFNLDS